LDSECGRYWFFNDFCCWKFKKIPKNQVLEGKFSWGCGKTWVNGTGQTSNSELDMGLEPLGENPFDPNQKIYSSKRKLSSIFSNSHWVSAFHTEIYWDFLTLRIPLKAGLGYERQGKDKVKTGRLYRYLYWVEFLHKVTSMWVRTGYTEPL